MAKINDIIPEVKEKTNDKELEQVFTKAKELIKGERISYTPNRVYELIFPNGLQLYYNRLVINLLFDGRSYNFTKPTIDFIERRLDEISKQESKKKKQFNNPIFGSIEG